MQTSYAMQHDALGRDPAYPPRDREDGELAMDIVKGAIAGLIGVFVMDRVDWFAFRHEDEHARRRTEAVRPDGLDPAHVAVKKASGLLGADYDGEQPHPAGVAIHYSLGIGPGAIYGALRDRVPVVGAGRGALWGFGLFAVQDEMVNAVTGLSARPRDYPWQAHARGLAAHVVYGLVTNLAFSAMKGRRH